ncbi:hypothetical protein [Paenibacillus sp. sgz500958]|uniref:hypothetical protein n=1 Tax=Paenibacillus sp. sgz500958 TaxID=3242475 RepID=UPI0036D34F08
MRTRYVLPVIVASLASLLLLSSCGGDHPVAAPGQENPPTATASASASPLPTVTASPAPSTEPPAEEPVVIQGSGTYIGQIDNHSVEIETEEGPTAFELGAGTESVPETLQMNDPVVFEFVEKLVGNDDTLKQRILSKLSLSEEDSGGAAGEVELPQNMTMKLNLEGNVEDKVAKLAHGDGYALYVLDILTFDQDQNRLFLTIDKDYYADIIKLPSDFNLDYLKLEGQEELAKTGKVSVITEVDRPDSMSDARLFLSATGKGSIMKYIVKEIDGQGYIFKLHIPMGDALEGFPPHVYSSLNSIVNQ